MQEEERDRANELVIHTDKLETALGFVDEESQSLVDEFVLDENSDKPFDYIFDSVASDTVEVWSEFEQKEAKPIFEKARDLWESAKTGFSGENLIKSFSNKAEAAGTAFCNGVQKAFTKKRDRERGLEKTKDSLQKEKQETLNGLWSQTVAMTGDPMGIITEEKNWRDAMVTLGGGLAIFLMDVVLGMVALSFFGTDITGMVFTVGASLFMFVCARSYGRCQAIMTGSKEALKALGKNFRREVDDHNQPIYIEKDPENPQKVRGVVGVFDPSVRTMTVRRWTGLAAAATAALIFIARLGYVLSASPAEMGVAWTSLAAAILMYLITGGAALIEINTASRFEKEDREKYKSLVNYLRRVSRELQEVENPEISAEEEYQNSVENLKTVYHNAVNAAETEGREGIQKIASLKAAILSLVDQHNYAWKLTIESYHEITQARVNEVFERNEGMNPDEYSFDRNSIEVKVTDQASLEEPVNFFQEVVNFDVHEINFLSQISLPVLEGLQSLAEKGVIEKEQQEAQAEAKRKMQQRRRDLW